ncbi:uncharacterized protein LOC142236589 [Haematobia irritans]|uniref:uncharacterized protein LOC142236589 n=1 Tax=Haematobia irritans TaxID=7368 RepID=UPI003F4FDC40
MTAENYHLKWDSHSTYLNSSVATLYKNEKYADVVLYSSNTLSTTSSMPTVGISAHKFILSSCSQFFSSIFETSPIANGSNGQFHIILPPDLSHRAIQILVQYMYVGEATVSNDILSEVLKGGEMLKIRGLCRTPSPIASNMQQQTVTTSNAAATYNLIRMPLSTGPTSVRYLVEQQQTVSRSLGTSGLPKTSPVIMKSTKPISTLTVPSAAVSMGNIASSSNAITINKHVAIDPGEKCCYAPVQETSTATTALRDESTTSICNELGCNGCSRITDNPPSQIILQRDCHTHNEANNSTMCTKNCTDYMQQSTSGSECPEDNPSNLYEQEIHLSSTNDHTDGSMHDYVAAADGGFNYSKHLPHSKQATSVIRGEGDMQHLVSTSPSTHSQQVVAAGPSYVSIKEEPADWVAAPSSTIHSMKKNGNTDFKVQKIKTEPSSSQLTSSLALESESNGRDFDGYLACDICKKVCEDKTSLLRHLETHAAPNTSSGSSVYTGGSGETTPVQKSSYVPKKRRRISQQENTSDHVCLQCDICSTRFETPQEWVRHMSSQHTEIELAIYNNKKDAEKNQQQSNSNHKKMGCNQQQHHSQRVGGSTNSNLPNNSSVLCSSSPNGSGIHDTNVTGYLRTTLSPA